MSSSNNDIVNWSNVVLFLSSVLKLEKELPHKLPWKRLPVFFLSSRMTFGRFEEHGGLGYWFCQTFNHVSQHLKFYISNLPNTFVYCERHVKTASNEVSKRKWVGRLMMIFFLHAWPCQKYLKLPHKKSICSVFFVFWLFRSFSIDLLRPTNCLMQMFWLCHNIGPTKVKLFSVHYAHYVYWYSRSIFNI